jgi:hypothetical protein
MKIARHKVQAEWYMGKTLPAACRDADTILGSWGIPLLHFIVPQDNIERKHFCHYDDATTKISWK